MQTPDVLKKLDTILTAAERDQRFGSVEITIRGGRVTVITTSATDRLDQYQDNREITDVNPPNPTARFHEGSVLFGTVDEMCQELGTSYEEFLDHLRREGYGIVFDVSKVPPQHYDAHKLAGFELTCTIQMMDQGFRAALCLHEAAHAEYNERIPGVRCICIGGPYAFVNSKSELKYANAHVYDGTMSESDTLSMDDLDFVKSILCAGIAEEVMTGCPTDGTGLDEALLRDTFDQNNVPAEERQRLIDQARADILKDLRKPAFRQALWARAKFFQRILERSLWLVRT